MLHLSPPPCTRSAIDGFPVPRHLVALMWWLHREGYSQHAIDQAVEHAHRYGTLACTPYIDDEDRDAAEALLPMDPAWDDARWDAIRVSLP